MGLIHPTDLDSWHRWQQRQQSLRWARRVVELRAKPSDHRLLTFGDPTILVALDSDSTSKRAALLDPLAFLDLDDVALLVEGPYCPVDRRPQATTPVADAADVVRLAPGIQAVIAAGNYLPSGDIAHQAARRVDATFLVVQHGLLTPFAPPLPTGAHLLAWSQQDADFWRSQRADVTCEVIGSQLMWKAAQRPAFNVDPAEPVRYLGQLHGAELPRGAMARAAYRFCTENDAIYRPHPAESDVLSRAQHAIWERRGVRIDQRKVELRDLMAPVVSVFSTGVIEAAAMGLPSWVHFPDPPVWVDELWDRYGVHRWGDTPTPAAMLPSDEPAKRVAEIATERTARST